MLESILDYTMALFEKKKVYRVPLKNPKGIQHMPNYTIYYTSGDPQNKKKSDIPS